MLDDVLTLKAIFVILCKHTKYSKATVSHSHNELSYFPMIDTSLIHVMTKRSKFPNAVVATMLTQRLLKRTSLL